MKKESRRPRVQRKDLGKRRKPHRNGSMNAHCRRKENRRRETTWGPAVKSKAVRFFRKLKDRKIRSLENQKIERLRNGKPGGSENRNAEYQNQNTVGFHAVAFCQLAFPLPESGLSLSKTASDRKKRVQKEKSE
ncbi:hypothetical protein [Oribacterium sp. oral taxon 078]|uniref:hypothetical protein n=1 Tax=Oribacterium sp. oral taxon 078 TaxID=652706 RepID=UPI0018CB40D3|nr:hypothetical protein [Oribacterium sp. oral taxon 078]